MDSKRAYVEIDESIRYGLKILAARKDQSLKSLVKDALVQVYPELLKQEKEDGPTILQEG